jgi:hypothetical protein
MLGSIRRHCAAALDGFSTEECVMRFRLLDRLRNSLGRIGGRRRNDASGPAPCPAGAFAMERKGGEASQAGSRAMHRGLAKPWFSRG